MVWCPNSLRYTQYLLETSFCYCEINPRKISLSGVLAGLYTLAAIVVVIFVVEPGVISLLRRYI